MITIRAANLFAVTTRVGIVPGSVDMFNRTDDQSFLHKLQIFADDDGSKIIVIQSVLPRVKKAGIVHTRSQIRKRLEVPTRMIFWADQEEQRIESRVFGLIRILNNQTILATDETQHRILNDRNPAMRKCHTGRDDH